MRNQRRKETDEPTKKKELGGATRKRKNYRRRGMARMGVGSTNRSR